VNVGSLDGQGSRVESLSGLTPDIRKFTQASERDWEAVWVGTLPRATPRRLLFPRDDTVA